MPTYMYVRLHTYLEQCTVIELALPFFRNCVFENIQYHSIRTGRLPEQGVYNREIIAYIYRLVGVQHIRTAYIINYATKYSLVIRALACIALHSAHNSEAPTVTGTTRITHVLYA